MWWLGVRVRSFIREVVDLWCYVVVGIGILLMIVLNLLRRWMLMCIGNFLDVLLLILVLELDEFCYVEDELVFVV